MKKPSTEETSAKTSTTNTRKTNTNKTNNRRDKIVLAATNIIATEGLTTLSVRTLATRADCSRGLVEHYFQNKTALLVAAEEWANSRYLERVNAAVGDLAGLKALEIRLQNLIPYEKTVLDEWKIRVAFWHQGISMPLMEESNNRSFYAVYNPILEDVRRAHTLGEIDKSIPIVETAEMLLFMIIGLCTSCINDVTLRQKQPLDRRVKMMLGFLKTGKAAAFAVGDPAVDY